jgi:hypothetical protein
MSSEGTDDPAYSLPRPEKVAREAEEQQPVEEAGGGVAEGFEQAEEELVARAEGEAGKGHPLGDRFPAEEEKPEAHTIHGEADSADREDPSAEADQDR